MKRLLALLALTCMSSPRAYAVSCGTVAAPLACSIAVGKVLYSFTDFTFVLLGSNGPVYSGSDVSIDLNTPDQHTALLAFAKNDNSPGTAFSVSVPSQTVYFAVEYKATISAIGAGAVAYDAPVSNVINGSATGSGSTGVNLSMASPAKPLSCSSGVDSSGPVSQPCNFPGLTIPLNNSIWVEANVGTANLASFSNSISAKFAEPLNLDVDGNGTADAQTDGLLLIRYLLGVRGEPLITNAVDPGALRATAPQVEQYIERLLP